MFVCDQYQLSVRSENHNELNQIIPITPLQRFHRTTPRTFLEAFSIALHLTPSNLVSYSLAPPRIARTSDGGAVTTELLRWDHAAVPPMPDRAASEKMQFFIISGSVVCCVVHSIICVGCKLLCYEESPRLAIVVGDVCEPSTWNF